MVASVRVCQELARPATVSATTTVLYRSGRVLQGLVESGPVGSGVLGRVWYDLVVSGRVW